VGQVVASGLLPGAMEIMDALAIEAAEAAVHAGYPRDAAALLIVELEGERIQVEAEFATAAVIEASGP
jgi:glycolate oxidase